ncbi:MAG: two-component system response regulator [Gammaproteobacteria bacterium]|nr:MAG: two-component system response regulator [Gammaproteobacteria bacterium]
MQTEINTKAANILIVDDQIVNIKLLEKILKQDGYENVFSTIDSREAVPLFLEHNIDILLLDIRMPHLDGFEVMALLNEAITDDYLPILVLTAELTKDTRVRSLEIGAKDFLTKPFDRLEVLQRIHNILEVRLLHTQLRNQNEILEQKVKLRTAEIERSRYEVIERLGQAAEYKDNETGNHIIRMSQYSRLLAIAKGLPDSEVELIFLAAPMHDIGKIAIPDYVLLKPGKLNAEEWEIMKTHVIRGYELLSGSDDVPLMKTARNIALTHHEKWDGSGYPYGISGEEIPLEGRICAICDVFDALTSERPYKKAWSVEEAMILINKESGHHFDPELVPLFESILADVLIYKQKHNDNLLVENDEQATQNTYS